MKYIRTYEDVDEDVDVPQIGDYVICEDDDTISFPIENYIGEIVDIENSVISNDIFYKIEYKDLEDWWYFYFKDILHFSSNKKDLEMYVNANKYNL